MVVGVHKGEEGVVCCWIIISVCVCLCVFLIIYIYIFSYIVSQDNGQHAKTAALEERRDSEERIGHPGLLTNYYSFFDKDRSESNRHPSLVSVT